MYRIILALAAASVLSACDGTNPLTAPDLGIGVGTQPLTAEEEVDAEAGDTDTDPDNLYGTAADEDLTMNNMSFDATTGELVLNGLPFDGDDNIYTKDDARTAGLFAGGSPFEVYANVSGTADYYAVFRRTDSGYAQVGAVSTDRYLSFGFGGVAAQRLSGTGALPSTDESYLFVGEYAAVRTVLNETSGTSVQYVSGTARIDVDIEDFDTTGAVEGVIVDRRFFDANGVRIGILDNYDFLSLATAEINFDNWTISSSTATGINAPDGATGVSGTWQGLFAGPNGEEVAGIVIVEGDGPIGIDPATGEYIEMEVREVGGFVAAR